MRLVILLTLPLLTACATADPATLTTNTERASWEWNPQPCNIDIIEGPGVERELEPGETYWIVSEGHEPGRYIVRTNCPATARVERIAS